jgi:hypothetical protein
VGFEERSRSKRREIQSRQNFCRGRNGIEKNDETRTNVSHWAQHRLRLQGYKEVLLTVKLEEGGAELAQFFESCPTFCTMVNEYTKKIKNPRPMAYYYHKIDKWIGPKLKDLALFLNVEYDEALAHSSEYDVDVTYKCYVKLIDGTGF